MQIAKHWIDQLEDLTETEREGGVKMQLETQTYVAVALTKNRDIDTNLQPFFVSFDYDAYDDDVCFTDLENRALTKVQEVLADQHWGVGKWYSCTVLDNILPTINGRLPLPIAKIVDEQNAKMAKQMSQKMTIAESTTLFKTLSDETNRLVKQARAELLT